MTSSTVTSKGQVTIPAEVRRQLSLKSGDKVAFYLENGKVVLKPVIRKAGAAFGLKRATRSVSLEEMDRAIKQRASK
jgi:looped-hinge helix DNA binding domain, AbrB family